MSIPFTGLARLPSSPFGLLLPSPFTWITARATSTPFPAASLFTCFNSLFASASQDATIKNDTAAIVQWQNAALWQRMSWVRPPLAAPIFPHHSFTASSPVQITSSRSIDAFGQRCPLRVALWRSNAFDRLRRRAQRHPGWSPYAAESFR